jgi:hemerythrin
MFSRVKYALLKILGIQHKYMMSPVPAYIEKNDTDHKEILDHFATLPAGEVQQLAWLYTSMDLLVEHFSYEEQWMTSVGYPGFELHQQVHKEYLRLLMNIITDTSKHPENITDSITMFTRAIKTHKEAETMSLHLYYTDTVPAPLGLT